MSPFAREVRDVPPAFGFVPPAKGLDPISLGSCFSEPQSVTGHTAERQAPVAVSPGGAALVLSTASWNLSFAGSEPEGSVVGMAAGSLGVEGAMSSQDCTPACMCHDNVWRSSPASGRLLKTFNNNL